LSIARFMAKLTTSGWGVDLRSPPKTSVVAASSNETLPDGRVAGGPRSRGWRSKGKVPLVEHERPGAHHPATHDRWPGWFRISFILGATGLLWGLIFHSL
jgi:hypothetical protein